MSVVGYRFAPSFKMLNFELILNSKEWSCFSLEITLGNFLTTTGSYRLRLPAWVVPYIFRNDEIDEISRLWITDRA